MSKKRNQPTKLRGPSRPIDPRYPPGRPARRGPDNFGLGLIAVSMLAAIAVILFLASQRGQTTTTTTTLDPSTAATATSVAFNAQATTLAKISPQEAKALLDANNAKFIDVRVNTEYAKQHIKGAVNIPYTEAQQRVAEFPREGNVILYCQWPNDEESASVALSLRASGYTNVKVLQGPLALTAWTSAGGPVEP